jgi:hypothetical protein
MKEACCTILLCDVQNSANYTVRNAYKDGKAMQKSREQIIKVR